MKTIHKHSLGSNIPQKTKSVKLRIRFIVYSSVILIILVFNIAVLAILYEKSYTGKIFPNVYVDSVPFGKKEPRAVSAYLESKNKPFQSSKFEFFFADQTATISGVELDLGYDTALSAEQAYLVGRSGNIFTDTYYKYWHQPVNLSPFFRWKQDLLNQMLEGLSEKINVEPQEALFNFDGGKVTAFKPSKDGRVLNIEKTKQRFVETLLIIPEANQSNFDIPAVVETIKPQSSTGSVNSFGIRELVGKGYSEYTGSITGRIHNVALAASRFNGVLIAPGETMSFNKTLGDVSAATGYQSAYIIKNGRTVLGDGGGVCQVSTTLFRAALDAGLPIPERHAHAYRVHYYEEGGYKAGLDATVFDPTYDLKITNDTPAHILIQTKTDTRKLTLLFELYGTKDGRKATISNHRVWGNTPPPPDLEQEDPTLKTGTRKQVDWAAWGAKAEFDYQVTRGNEMLTDTSFFSNYRPWQAVYLVGTMP